MQHVWGRIYNVQFFLKYDSTRNVNSFCWYRRLVQISITLFAKLYGVFTAYIMLLIALSYRRWRNLQAK